MPSAKESWKVAMAKIQHQEYFSTVTNPYDIDHFKFFESINAPAKNYEAAEAEWKRVLHVFASNDNQTLRRISKHLTNLWEKDVELGKVKRFWEQISMKEAVELDRATNFRINTAIKEDYIHIRSKKDISAAPVRSAETSSNAKRSREDDDESSLPTCSPLHEHFHPQTESIDSPITITAESSVANPFILEENYEDILIPASVSDGAFAFQGVFEGIDIGSLFQPYFYELKQKSVHIGNIDEALGRSGILYLRGCSRLQAKHFGTALIADLEKKFRSRYWKAADVNASRTQARLWLDILENCDYDRATAFSQVAKLAPQDPGDETLWCFIASAIKRLPVEIAETEKSYSESAGIASYILPICEVFLQNPNDKVFLNYGDGTTASGDARSIGKSSKQPDIVLELKDQVNRTLCDLGIGEVTSHALKNNCTKNAKDLVRIGLCLKDAIDYLDDAYDVRDSYLLGLQVIAQRMDFYIMSKCGNMYIMAHQGHVTIPDCLQNLSMIGSEYKAWRELQATIMEGIKPVLRAVFEGRTGKTKEHFPTLSTPEVIALAKRRRT